MPPDHTRKVETLLHLYLHPKKTTMDSAVTYAVELYFDKTLENKITNIRQTLVSLMNNNKVSHKKSLTMTTSETHRRPCITLFTAATPQSSCNVLINLIKTLNNFFSDKKSKHGLPVALDLIELVDLGDTDYMYLAPMDRNNDVRSFRRSICEAVRSSGVDMNRDYKVWHPVVPVAKQSWAQYDARKAHEEAVWVKFCKENGLALFGTVVEVGLVQVSPGRALLETYDLVERAEHLCYGGKFFRTLGFINYDSDDNEEPKTSKSQPPMSRVFLGDRCFKVVTSPTLTLEPCPV